jgi:hypothetical protein
MKNGRTYDHRRRGERAAWPNTAMARAYLVALLNWASTNHANADARVTLPVGIVGPTELMNVLRALEKARQQTDYPRPTN